MDISLSIKTLRSRRGLTLKQVSERTGLSISYLSDIETSRANNPSLDAIQAIADSLGYRVRIVFTDTNGEDVDISKLQCVEDLREIFAALNSNVRDLGNVMNRLREDE